MSTVRTRVCLSEEHDKAHGNSPRRLKKWLSQHPAVTNFHWNNRGVNDPHFPAISIKLCWNWKRSQGEPQMSWLPSKICQLENLAPAPKIRSFNSWIIWVFDLQEKLEERMWAEEPYDGAHGQEETVLVPSLQQVLWQAIGLGEAHPGAHRG